MNGKGRNKRSKEKSTGMDDVTKTCPSDLSFNDIYHPRFQ